MLEARHTVTLTKNGVAVVAQSKSRVVEHGELIELGHCSYAFECTELSGTPAFKQELVAFMKEHRGPQWSLHQLLSQSLLETTVAPPAPSLKEPLGRFPPAGRMRAVLSRSKC